MRIKKSVISSVFLIPFSLLYAADSDTPYQDKDVHYVTIFVHGVVSIKQHLTLPNVVKFIQDKITNTHYVSAVCKIRQDPFFLSATSNGTIGTVSITSTGFNQR